MNIVICPFSGDPITYGHIDIIERCALLFDSVIAAVGVNPLKQYYFTMAERLQMASAALKHLPNVRVEGYEGLLADFARQQQCTAVVRGIRNQDDFAYEWAMHQINDSIDRQLETFWIPCRQEKENISSSLVKEYRNSGKSISHLVPEVVIRLWDSKFSATD